MLRASGGSKAAMRDGERSGGAAMREVESESKSECESECEEENERDMMRVDLCGVTKLEDVRRHWSYGSG